MIRRAAPADVPALVGLVYDLAEYENSRDECRLTAEQLHTALFGPNPALFAHVAQDVSTRAVLGCAIWFLNYSTWTGTHGIHLEDLFVTPRARGRGLGGALVGALAREAVTRGYHRVTWSVLDWNTPAIEFYEANEKEAQEIITKAVGAEPGSLDTSFSGVKLYNLAENKKLLPGEFITKTAVDVSKAANNAGILEEEIDPASVVEAAFVEAAK